MTGLVSHPLMGGEWSRMVWPALASTMEEQPVSVSKVHDLQSSSRISAPYAEKVCFLSFAILF